MSKTFAKGAFYFVAVVLFVWSAVLVYSFVSNVLPGVHWVVPLFALVVFGTGSLAWLKVFLDLAEGSGQRAVAVFLCGFDFLGDGLMILAEVFLGGQTLVSAPINLGEYAIWGLAIWTVINLGGVLLFHALSPDASLKAMMQSEKDAVIVEARKKLKLKREKMSGELSDKMSDGMLYTLLAELATDRDEDGIPDVYQGNGNSAVPVQAAADGVDFADVEVVPAPSRPPQPGR